jgi:hypothetical protein
MVTAPNLALSLERVPVPMAGAAGGALQTAQRIGGAIGTALLATIFYHELSRTDYAYPVAVSDTLWCASGLMLLALLLAIAELTRRRRRPGAPTRTPPAAPQMHHL